MAIQKLCFTLLAVTAAFILQVACEDDAAAGNASQLPEGTSGGGDCPNYLSQEQRISQLEQMVLSHQLALGSIGNWQGRTFSFYHILTYILDCYYGSITSYEKHPHDNLTNLAKRDHFCKVSRT